MQFVDYGIVRRTIMLDSETFAFAKILRLWPLREASKPHVGGKCETKDTRNEIICSLESRLRTHKRCFGIRLTGWR